MEGVEVRKLAALEDRHWWYRERRILLARELRRLGRPGFAVDVGAAGGGNTRVLKAHGWRPLAVEYGVEGAQVAAGRGLPVVRADARRLPLGTGTADLVVAFDLLEHLHEDTVAAGEFHRILRPGGVLLIAVPCDMALWSAHDVAVDHVRRYSRAGLRSVVAGAGFMVEDVWSWNVLLRPVAAWRRRRSNGSDLSDLSPVVNGALTAVITAERYLPVRSLPGVSLMLRARR